MCYGMDIAFGMFTFACALFVLKALSNCIHGMHQVLWIAEYSLFFSLDDHVDMWSLFLPSILVVPNNSHIFLLLSPQGHVIKFGHLVD